MDFVIYILTVKKYVTELKYKCLCMGYSDIGRHVNRPTFFASVHSLLLIIYCSLIHNEFLMSSKLHVTH